MTENLICQGLQSTSQFISKIAKVFSFLRFATLHLCDQFCLIVKTKT